MEFLLFIAFVCGIIALVCSVTFLNKVEKV